MDVNPTKRFQNVKAMQRALERLNLMMNWRENLLTNGTRWTCGLEKKCFEITRIECLPNKWSVFTKRGSSKYDLRKIRDLCQENIDKVKAGRLTQKILQDFVLGKLK